RCLINLSTWEEQQAALDRLASVLRPGGRLLFVEGSSRGRDSLNDFRERVGLPRMAPVWHNLDFDEATLLPFLNRNFEVEEDLGFGTYDFISRVVHPLLVAPAEPAYDSRANEVAARLALVSQAYRELS